MAERLDVLSLKGFVLVGFGQNTSRRKRGPEWGNGV